MDCPTTTSNPDLMPTMTQATHKQEVNGTSEGS
jgi:hypothetical protein